MMLKLPTAKEQIYSVSALNNEIKQTLASYYAEIWVEGEISNLSMPSSRHIYFNIKDANCQIRCAMFRSKNSRLKFKPENGMQVLLYAQPDVYAARGDLQLIVSQMEVAGAGKLQLEFERLKQKLLAEGLFEQELKKEIPRWPRRVGIVSSEKGAAVKDVISVINQRFPAIHLIIYPTLVQGKEAPEAICTSLRLAEQRNEVDLLLLVRGGGSIEDLSAFNDEGVARAIAQCELPIVSGVGHAIDSTIADFVCDQCAPTPSAAAELISPNQHEVARRFNNLQKHVQQLGQRALDNQVRRLELAQAKLSRFHPMSRIQGFIQQLDEIDRRLVTVVNHRLATEKEGLNHLEEILKHVAPLDQINKNTIKLEKVFSQLKIVTSHALSKEQSRINRLDSRLKNLNPLETLKRGYAIVADNQNRLLTSVKQVKRKQLIKITMNDGALSAQVAKVQHKKR